MKSIPIIPHHVAQPPALMLSRVDRYAQKLALRRPELASAAGFERVQAAHIDGAPTLHLDDQDGVRTLNGASGLSFRQDLARLRAGEGDFVAVCYPQTPGYEDYAREQLGLGSVQWIQTRAPRDDAHLAASLWQDENSRGKLIELLRQRGSLQIDPYRGTWGVWQFAALLAAEGAGEVRVIAPPPALCDWVNNKVSFSQTVLDLFGEQYIPRFTSVGNLAMAANRVRQLAADSAKIILKLPDSVGGGGNISLDAREFRGLSLQEIYAKLRRTFASTIWDGDCELLVGEWETQTLSSPSAQLWLPPGDEPPIVEGLYEQVFGSAEGMFVGTRRAELLPERAREMIDHCWLLGRLFQRLGYVGRCSFDTLLIADGHGRQRLKFLECNGRWGGASMPMTVMNRIFGDWTTQPYTYRTYEKLGLEKTSFTQVLDALRDELFDVRTGRGRLILANPARMPARGAISAIVLGASWDQSARAAREEVPARLATISKPLAVAAVAAPALLTYGGMEQGI
jgi:hypothetical protein